MSNKIWNFFLISKILINGKEDESGFGIWIATKYAVYVTS